MVRMLKTTVTGKEEIPNSFSPFNPKIAETKTLGNDIHSSQYHRSFCKGNWRPEVLISVVLGRWFTGFGVGNLRSG